MNKLDNAKGARVTDALLNYETGGPPRQPDLSRPRIEQRYMPTRALGPQQNPSRWWW